MTATRKDALRGTAQSEAFTVIALVFAGALSGAAAAAPPLIQPGAPGDSSRSLTAQQSIALSRTGYTEADIRFMQHMIVHHQQAVDMVALIEARTGDATVSRIGRRIALSQQGEMDQMRGWLSARDAPLTDPDLQPGHAHGGHGAHGHHGGHGGAPADPYHTPLMHGMLSPAQMDALAAAQGETFDRLFLEGMIHHHQGALDMVSALLDQPGAGEETSLSEFLSHVVADQSAEILRMGNLRSAMDPDSTHEDPMHEGHH